MAGAAFTGVPLSRALQDLVDNGHIYYKPWWPQQGPQNVTQLQNIVDKAAEARGPNSKTAQELKRLLRAAMNIAGEQESANKRNISTSAEILTAADQNLAFAHMKEQLGDINKEFLIVEYPAIDRRLVLPGTLITFEDRFKPNFHKEQVYGRMDPIVSYQNTNRAMNFSWEIDFSSGDTSWAYAALGDLAKMMYPVYQDKCVNRLGTGTLVAAPLLRFSLRSGDGGAVKLLRSPAGTAGQTINGILGVVESFEYLKMNATKGNFTMMRTPGVALGNNILPLSLTLNFGITVLHEGGKVGWVWEKSDTGVLLTFGQGQGYPYGAGTTLEQSPTPLPATGADADAHSASGPEAAVSDNAQRRALDGNPCGE
jgi:hypothetical protein